MTAESQSFQPKIPGIGLLILRICRIPAVCNTWECKLGFILLISNIPIGIAGAAICILLNSITNNYLFLLLGTVIYAFSWLCLLTGIFLTGKHLSPKIRQNIRIKIRAWKKIRKKLRQNYAFQG